MLLTLAHISFGRELKMLLGSYAVRVILHFLPRDQQMQDDIVPLNSAVSFNLADMTQPSLFM